MVQAKSSSAQKGTYDIGSNQHEKKGKYKVKGLAKGQTAKTTKPKKPLNPSFESVEPNYDKVETDELGTMYTLNGKLHRTDGPAFEEPDGPKYWYQNGELYRDGGLPTIEWPDGAKDYYEDGKRHKCEYPDGTEIYFRGHSPEHEKDLIPDTVIAKKIDPDGTVYTHYEGMFMYDPVKTRQLKKERAQADLAAKAKAAYGDNPIYEKAYAKSVAIASAKGVNLDSERIVANVTIPAPSDNPKEEKRRKQLMRAKREATMVLSMVDSELRGSYPSVKDIPRNFLRKPHPSDNKKTITDKYLDAF
jgi:hypothetical protein